MRRRLERFGRPRGAGGRKADDLAAFANGVRVKEKSLRLHSKLVVATAGLALVAAPAFAVPGQAPDNPGHAPATTPVGPPASTPPENRGTAHRPATPGPSAGLPAKAHAYGRYCQDQSKKRSDAAPGTKGTPFSQCVTAMAKLASGQTDNPRSACKDESKKHVAGQRGTPFSRCVSAAAKLLNDRA
jgi:hypothetical protein